MHLLTEGECDIQHSVIVQGRKMRWPLVLVAFVNGETFVQPGFASGTCKKQGHAKPCKWWLLKGFFLFGDGAVVLFFFFFLYNAVQCE